MKLTLWQRLDILARQITPSFLALILVMLSMVPLHLPISAPAVPWVALMAVYYWSLHRPDVMPAIAVFTIGVFHDLLAGTAVGLSALILLLVRAVVVTQRRFFASRGFWLIWIFFAVAAAGAGLAKWLAGMALAAQLLELNPVAFQTLLTVALYPPVAAAFARVQRAIAV